MANFSVGILGNSNIGSNSREIFHITYESAVAPFGMLTVGDDTSIPPAAPAGFSADALRWPR
jgi:hypothetical protein